MDFLNQIMELQIEPHVKGEKSSEKVLKYWKEYWEEH